MKRQGNIIAALMENWKDAEDSLQTALTSAGSAAEEHAKIMDSVAAKQKQFTTQMITFWTSAINTEGIKIFIDFGTSFVRVLTGIVKVTGLAPAAFGILMLWLGIFNKGLITSILSMNNWGLGLIGVNKRIAETTVHTAGLLRGVQGATVATNALTVSTLSLGAALKSITMFFARWAFPVAMVMGLSWAIGTLITKITESRKEAEAQRRELEQTVETYRENSFEIDKNIKRYEELTQKQKKNTEGLGLKEKKELLDLNNKLTSLFPNLISGYDAEGNALIELNKTTNSYLETLRELSGLKSEEIIRESGKNIEQAGKNLKQISRQLEDTRRSIELFRSGSISLPLPGQEKQSLEELERQLPKLIEEQNILVQKLASTYKSLNDAKLTSIKNSELLTEADRNYLNSLSEVFVREELLGELNEQRGSVENQLVMTTYQLVNIRKILNDETLTFFEIEKRVTEQLKSSWIDENKKIEITKELTKMKQELVKVTELEKNVIKEVTSLISTYIDEQKELVNIVDDLNKGEELSLETIVKLIDKYPSLISALENENGILKLNKDAVITLSEVKKQSFILEMNQQERLMKVRQEDLKQKISEISKETKVREALLELGRQELIQLRARSLMMGAPEDFIRELDVAIETEGPRKALNQVNEALKNLGKTISLFEKIDLNVLVDEKKEKKEIKEIDRITDAERNRKFALAETNKEISRMTSELSRQDVGSKEHNDLVYSLNEALKVRQRLLKEEADNIRDVLIPAVKQRIKELEKENNWTEENKKEYNDLVNEYESLINSLGQLSSGWYQSQQQVEENTESIIKYKKELKKLRKELEENNKELQVQQDIDLRTKRVERFSKIFGPTSEQVVSELFGSTKLEDEMGRTIPGLLDLLKEARLEEEKRASQARSELIPLQEDINKLLVNKENLTKKELEQLIKLQKEETEFLNIIKISKDNWNNYTNSIDEHNGVIQRTLKITSEYEKVLRNIDMAILDLEIEMSELDSNSSEYLETLIKIQKELGKKESVVSNEIENQKENIKLLEKRLKEEKLTEKIKDDLLEQLDEEKNKLHNLEKDRKQIVQANISNIKEMEKNRENSADKMIVALKKALTREKEIRLQALNKQIEDEEKAHDQRIKNLDEELNNYNRLVDLKLKLIDRTEDESSFEKDLGKLQEERAELQQKINVLALDDSIEARTRLSDLNKNLTDVDERIDELRHKRQIDLRKQNLKDEQETFNNSINEKKNESQEKLKAEKERLEKERKLQENNFELLLNDEKVWAERREILLSGSFTNITEMANGMFEDLKNGSSETFDSMIKNIKETDIEVLKTINTYNQLKDAIKEVTKVEEAQRARSIIPITPTNYTPPIPTTFIPSTKQQQTQQQTTVIIENVDVDIAEVQGGAEGAKKLFEKIADYAGTALKLRGIIPVFK